MNTLTNSLSNILIFFCFGIPLAFAGPVTSDILSAPHLIKALQGGGHIIYMRHGQTNHSQKDKNRRNFEDCSSQRNLSDEGRKQLQQIRGTIKALKIPLGNVLSSPYCRCKDTAQLVFGNFLIEPNLQFSISKNRVESQQLGEYLYTLMMNLDVGASNAILVGHTSNLRDGLGVWPKPEGVMTVFQKIGHTLVFKGMIKPDDWPDL